jgi:hypothetical protein
MATKMMKPAQKTAPKKTAPPKGMPPAFAKKGK